MRKPLSELVLSQPPLNDYGSLEPVIRAMRAHHSLDLNADLWRQTHPRGRFDRWQAQARACLMDGLHYDPGPLDLRPQVLSREERDHLFVERVAFNTTPWIRVEAWLLIPKGIPLPAPGLVVFHEWGGPMLFGKDRIVNSGRDHPALVRHREHYHSGRYLAEEFAGAGYVVIVIDAHHFGERIPKGLGGIPSPLDPYTLDEAEFERVDRCVREKLYLGVRQLNWAGTTWAGLNYWDDSRCIDYLVTRKEVAPNRIGCTGLSGGGWRTNMLAALDGRVRASVSVGWMTTTDYQQCYNVTGAVGTFCLLPGVWNRMDIPDMAVMSAPCACMVVNGLQDTLFPREGCAEAARQIQVGYEWAGHPDRFRHFTPDTDHCYNAEIQREAIAWFDRFLK